MLLKIPENRSNLQPLVTILSPLNLNTNVNTKHTNTYTQTLQIQIQIKIHKRRLSSEV